ELAGLEQTLRLFGFVPDSLDLRESFADVLTEQIGGYFDPDSNTLYVPTDIDSFIVRTSVTHELVHALQGQYLNLDSLLELKHANDRRSAAQAVLEGQATLVQTLVMMPEQRLDQLPSFWEARVATMAQQRRMPAFAHASRWLRETLIFPYLAGADFVRWYATTHPGRQPYGAAMPVSTEQILHPDRYAAGDAPLELAFVPPSPDTVRYEDDLGEFETRLLFAAYVYSPLRTAHRRAAAPPGAGRAVRSGCDRCAARDPPSPTRGGCELRGDSRVRRAGARAGGGGASEQGCQPRPAGGEAGARRNRRYAGRYETGARLRIRGPHRDPARGFARLGENHDRGEAGAAAQTRAEGAVSRRGGRVPAGGGGAAPAT